MTPTLIKNFETNAAIVRHRIVAVTARATVAQASAADQPLIGVADELGADGAGRVDVHLTGVTEIEAGAAIAVGAALTTDAQGRAVTVATGNRQIGIALAPAGSAGEIIPVLLVQG